MRLPAGWLSRVAKVFESFFAEAAVLLLVFPVLDRFVEHGMAGVSFKLIAASLIGTLAFLSVALLIAIYVKEGDR